MGWILGGVFVVTTLIFIALAVLFPEFVGIQGKLAEKIEADQREQSPPKE
jgi:hypothetical protein